MIRDQNPSEENIISQVNNGFHSQLGDFLKGKAKFIISEERYDEAYKTGKGKEIEDKLSYAMAATPLYQEYLFLEEYSSQVENGMMNIETLIDYFMKRIYKMSIETDNRIYLNSNELGEYFSITSLRKVKGIMNTLIETKLIKSITQQADHSYLFVMDIKGEHYIEENGNSALIKNYFNNSTAYMDKRVFITKSTGVQINIDSTNSVQNVSIKSYEDVDKILEKMIQILKTDDQNSVENNEEQILNIESLKTEIKKKNPKFEYIKDYLSIASNSIKIAEYLPGV